MRSTLQSLNALSDQDAHAALTRCCGASRWVAVMIAGRPYDTEEALFTAASIAVLSPRPTRRVRCSVTCSTKETSGSPDRQVPSRHAPVSASAVDTKVAVWYFAPSRRTLGW